MHISYELPRVFHRLQEILPGLKLTCKSAVSKCSRYWDIILTISHLNKQVGFNQCGAHSVQSVVIPWKSYIASLAKQTEILFDLSRWGTCWALIMYSSTMIFAIMRHLLQAVNAIQEWATRNGFRFAAHKSKVIHFTAPRSRAQRPPIVRIGNTLLPVEESTKFHGLWWDSHLLFKKHISVLKTQGKEALQLIRVVAHLKWGGNRDTLLMLYRAIVSSKFDYGCIVYGTASNTNLRQLDSIHNSGLRLALGAFCTSPVSSLYTEANKAPLEERRLKLSMHYYVKTRACIDNRAHHALHELDRTTRDLYAPWLNGRGGMTRPPAHPIGLKVEEAMTSAEINAELVCPLRTWWSLYWWLENEREWEQRQSSTVFSRMVRQPATNCPKDW